MIESEANILILDDEELVIHGLNRTLKTHGYHALTTTKPEKAMDIMMNHNIGVFICDQRMPEMMGNDVLQYAKTHFPDMVRILLTGYSDLNSTISAINNGLIFRYIAKPWKDSEIIDAIKEAYAYREEKIKKDYIITNFHLEKEMWKETFDELQLILGNRKNGAMNALLRTMKAKDIELYNHSTRVESLAVKIAEELDYSAERIGNLSLAGLFHDIGKLTINDHIVYKEGPLDEMSYDLIKEHVVYGFEIIKELGFMDPVADIILGHHERMDGSGYPLGSTGKDISHEARILAIVDVYDALVTDRVYHKAISPAEAMNLMGKDADTKYDRRILEAFRILLGYLEK